MYHDLQPSGQQRLPTLVQYCQRVASTHVESISSLGDGLRFELLKPVLFGCSAETLLRLEISSPYIINETGELWQQMCFKSYPLAADRYHSGHLGEPDSWRDQYFVLREEEARRFKELGSRLRNQRQEAEERKKSQAIQLTDQLPLSAKRLRSMAPSKTLFQKTRSEASKIQKTMYTRLTPSMPRVKDYRCSGPSMSLLPPPPLSSTGSGVIVKTVTYRRPPPSSSASSSSATSVASVISSSASSRSPVRPPTQTNDTPAHSPFPSPLPLNKSPVAKKDPKSSIFMPKHRAYSQRPGQAPSLPSR